MYIYTEDIRKSTLMSTPMKITGADNMDVKAKMLPAESLDTLLNKHSFSVSLNGGVCIRHKMVH